MYNFFNIYIFIFDKYIDYIKNIKKLCFYIFGNKLNQMQK